MSFLLCGSRKEWLRFDLIAGITPPIALILDCSAIPDADTTTAAIFGERIDEIEDAGTPVYFARSPHVGSRSRGEVRAGSVARSSTASTPPSRWPCRKPAHARPDPPAAARSAWSSSYDRVTSKRPTVAPTVAPITALTTNAVR